MRPIVIIDSGIGGLNIVKNIKKAKPKQKIIYLADQGFFPYGDKDLKILRRRINVIIKKVKEINPEYMVFGCNTIEANFTNIFRAQGIKTVSIIQPVMEEAIKNSFKGNIAVLATTATIESQAYPKAAIIANKTINMFGVECPKLASYIEEKQNFVEILNDYIKPIKEESLDVIILGCTHYAPTEKYLSKIFPESLIIDSTKVVSKKIINQIKDINNYSEEIDEYYTSGDINNFKKILDEYKLMGNVSNF